MDKLKAMFNEPVGSLRLQKVLTVSEMEPVLVAVTKMHQFRTSSVIAMKKGDVTGIFSEDDLAKRVLAKNLDLSSTPIKSVMSPNPLAIKASTTVRDALKIMRKNHIHHIPVLNESEEAGFLGILPVMQILELVGSYFPEEVYSPWHTIRKNDHVW